MRRERLRSSGKIQLTLAALLLTLLASVACTHNTRNQKPADYSQLLYSGPDQTDPDYQHASAHAH